MNRKKWIAIFSLLLAFSLPILADDVVIDEITVAKKLYPAGFEKEFQNNLNFFRDGVGVDPYVKVPYDTILIKNGKIEAKYYSNITEMGLYLNVLTESAKAGNKKAVTRIQQTLTHMENAPKWKGLFHWVYNIENNKLVTNSDGIIPAVDNANFTFSAFAVAGAFMNSPDPDKQDIVKRIETILANQREGWLALYDKKNQLIHAGWSTKDNALLDYYLDNKANESRTAPIWAILTTQHLAERAIPDHVFHNMKLYTTRYQVNGQTLEPLITWDGAYFQVMMPQIWLNEKALIPNYKMVEDHTLIQKQYTREHGIPLISSSATIDDSYHPYGVPGLSESKIRYDNEIREDYTGTPHATALSYIVDPIGAVQSLKKIKKDHPNIESPFGWFDAIDNKGNIAQKIISLDAGMFVTAFMAKEINADVESYLKSKGYLEKLQSLYKGYVPDEVF